METSSIEYDLPSEWAGLNLKAMVEAFSKLKNGAGKNLIPPSYARVSKNRISWDIFTPYQKGVIVNAWNALPENLKDLLVREINKRSTGGMARLAFDNEPDEGTNQGEVSQGGGEGGGVTAGGASLLNASSSTSLVASSSCATNTNKIPPWNIDDWARLIHLYADPKFSSFFSRIATPKTREALDDRNNHMTHSDPWEDISLGFNDYDNNVYANKTYVVGKDGTNTVLRGYTKVYALCGDYNPCNRARAPFFRSADELKDKLTELKTGFSVCYQNYTKSGQHQDEDDKYDEFCNFVNTNVKCAYAFTVWSLLNINMLGKLLDESISCDSGILGSDSSEKTLNPITSKRKRTSSSGSNSLLSNATTTSSPPAATTTNGGGGEKQSTPSFFESPQQHLPASVEVIDLTANDKRSYLETKNKISALDALSKNTTRPFMKKIAEESLAELGGIDIKKLKEQYPDEFL